MLRLAYDDLVVQLTVTIEVCDGCARSKAKLRAVTKKTYTPATNTVERIFVDTTGLFPESLIGNHYWIFILYDYIRYYWRLFIKEKPYLPKKMVEFCFNKMTPHCTPVQYLHCDNAGELQSKLQKVCKKENSLWSTLHLIRPI